LSQGKVILNDNEREKTKLLNSLLQK